MRWGFFVHADNTGQSFPLLFNLSTASDPPPLAKGRLFQTVLSHNTLCFIVFPSNTELLIVLTIDKFDGKYL